MYFGCGSSVGLFVVDGGNLHWVVGCAVMIGLSGEKGFWKRGVSGLPISGSPIVGCMSSKTVSSLAYRRFTQRL